MFPKSPDASAQGSPLSGLLQRIPRMAGPTGMGFGQSQRRAQPMMSDFSGWTLKPEFREDLGDRADFMEQMLRVIGPSMLGGRGKMFYQFMSPPDTPAPQRGNSFADMLSGRGSLSGQRGGGMSLAANSMLSRRF